MATFKLYPNGVTMGRGNPNPVGGIRGEVVGWSAGAVRRHKAWLYSVQADALMGHGDAVTLTMRLTPSTSDDWTRLLRAFIMRVTRIPGYQRHHWVVEWQRRGTPHLHMAVYGDEGIGHRVVTEWLAVAEPFEVARRAQFVTPITGPVGWLQYLSKHASRGVQHYQRQGKPSGWQKTGRLWGKGGDWHTVEPLTGTVDQSQYVQLRRLIRAYASAEARVRAAALRDRRHVLELERRQVLPMSRDERSAWRAVKRLRRMHSTPDVGLSSSRGVSEWVPESVVLRFLDLSAAPATI